MKWLCAKPQDQPVGFESRFKVTWFSTVSEVFRNSCPFGFEGPIVQNELSDEGYFYQLVMKIAAI